MKSKIPLSLLSAFGVCTAFILFSTPAIAISKPEVVIVSQSDSALSSLAAQEVRRYVYLRTGE